MAAHLGLTELVSRLVLNGSDINIDSRDPLGATALMYAAALGDNGVDVVDRLLSAGANAALTDNAGATALTRAVLRESDEVVDRLLLEAEVNINAVPTNYNYTTESWIISAPVLVLSIQLNAECIFEKLLAREDIDVNASSSDGTNTLHWACDCKAQWAVEALVAHPSINLDFPRPDDNTSPLFSAAVMGWTAAIDLLLDHGASIDCVDDQNATPLFRAADFGQVDVVRQLIQRGINVNAKDVLDRGVLHAAAVNQSWPVLRVLLQDAHNIDLDAQGVDGETALHDACLSADATGASMLVAAGARCDIPNRCGRTAVDLASLHKLKDTIKVLETARGYQNAKGATTWRAKTLAEAVVSDPYNVLVKRVQQLVAAGPEKHRNVNADKSSTGRDTPSLFSELNNAPSAFSGTPLHIACENSRDDVARLLLDAGAAVDLTNHFSRTPLFLAIHVNSLPCVKVLLAYGADPEHTPFANLALWEYSFSLSLRAELQHEVAFCLLKHGAKVSSKSPYLQLALQQAISGNNVSVVKRLVEGGAAIGIKDEHGLTAISLAERCGAMEVLEYLVEIGDRANM